MGDREVENGGDVQVGGAHESVPPSGGPGASGTSSELRGEAVSRSQLRHA